MWLPFCNKKGKKPHTAQWGLEWTINGHRHIDVYWKKLQGLKLQLINKKVACLILNLAFSGCKMYHVPTHHHFLPIFSLLALTVLKKTHLKWNIDV